MLETFKIMKVFSAVDYNTWFTTTESQDIELLGISGVFRILIRGGRNRVWSAKREIDPRAEREKFFEMRPPLNQVSPPPPET